MVGFTKLEVLPLGVGMTSHGEICLIVTRMGIAKGLIIINPIVENYELNKETG